MITITTTSAKTSVLNIRIDDATKAAIATESIRDGRSMSDIALRAIKLGLAQMTTPAPEPEVEAPKAAKAKAKRRKGDDGAAPAVAGKPRPKK
jgi:negative regulator of replication initiation